MTEHAVQQSHPGYTAPAPESFDEWLELAYEADREEFRRGRPITRRSLMWMVGGLLTTTALGVAAARVTEPHDVQVDNVTLTVARLPAHLAGKRIAQISDIHVGAYLSPEQAAAAIDRVNALDVDLLMLTGDFATVRENDRNRRMARREQALMTLIEPLRRAAVPMYAITGNHDHWGGLEPVLRMLAEAGANVLRNEAVQVDAGLWLAGVEDVWGGRPDLSAALGGIPGGAATLLMAHAPDYFENVLRREAPVSAQLSGHTHGGQVRLPRLTPGEDGLYTYAPIVPDYGTRYPIGLRRVGERIIYTNRGLGTWPIPFRINCPPEITVFTLQQPG